MASNPSRGTNKFEARGVPCVFVGYPLNKRGYKLLNLKTNVAFVSRDVRFYEGIYPYKLLKSSQKSVENSNMKSLCQDQRVTMYEDELGRSENENEVEAEQETDLPPETYLDTDLHQEADLESDEPVQTPPPVRQSTRVYTPPKWMSDYQAYNVREVNKPAKIKTTAVVRAVKHSHVLWQNV